MTMARRALFGLAVALLAVLGLASPASAHAGLVSSDPAEGARLDTAPSAVTLTFSEPIQNAGVNQVAVTGPDGGQWVDGPVQIKSNVVTAPLRPLGPAGEYVIGYRVLSADGHPVSEELRFTLTTPGPGTSQGAQATQPNSPQAGTPSDNGAGQNVTQPDSSGGVPVWVWVVGAIVLVVIGLGVALRMGRSGEE